MTAAAACCAVYPVDASVSVRRENRNSMASLSLHFSCLRGDGVGQVGQDVGVAGFGFAEAAEPLADQFVAYVAGGDVANFYAVSDVAAVVADGIRCVLPSPGVAPYPDAGGEFVQLCVGGGFVQSQGAQFADAGRIDAAVAVAGPAMFVSYLVWIIGLWMAVSPGALFSGLGTGCLICPADGFGRRAWQSVGSWGSGRGKSEPGRPAFRATDGARTSRGRSRTQT